MITALLPNPTGGHTAYGITVYELGEEGNLIAAFGHHDKRRFFAACNHLARTVWGLENLHDGHDALWADVVEEIEQHHATYEPGDEWAIEYAPEGADTVPVTVWEG